MFRDLTRQNKSASREECIRLLEDEKRGVFMAGRGLCEYEVLRDEGHTMALTLHRGVHELGDWGVYLTPTKTMPRNWFPEKLKGLKILGLASGGGQQMPVFAALGADCTVLDYSEKQLENEKKWEQE